MFLSFPEIPRVISAMFTQNEAPDDPTYAEYQSSEGRGNFYKKELPCVYNSLESRI